MMGLTPRQKQVAALVAEGLTNEQIGNRLYITRDTVKSTLSVVYSRLGCGSRAELAALVAGEARPVPDVGALIAEALANAQFRMDSSRWGSTDWYEQSGAVSVLRKLIERIGKVT